MNNIAILTTSDFPIGGAAENFVREMAIGLKESSNNVNVKVVRFWGKRYSSNNNTGIKCSNYLFRKPLKNNFLKFFELLLQILYAPFFVLKTKFVNHDNILLLYGLDRAYMVTPILIMSKVCKLKCIRIITEIYQKEDYAYSWWRKPLVLFNNIQFKYVDKYLDGIVVLSNFLKNFCITNGVNRNNIIVIPHFIPFDTPIVQVNAIKDIKTKSFDIMYSGSITVENGVTDLVDAFILCKKKYSIHSSLTIMGDKNVRIFDEFKEAELREFDINFTGYLQREDVFRNLLTASLLVNPRRYSVLADSGFPTKIGEYFSTKIPVLTTSVGDLASYFTHGNEVFFVQPNDIEQLSEMIYYVYSHPTEGQIVGNRGYAWGCGNLDRGKNAQKMLYFLFR